MKIRVVRRDWLQGEKTTPSVRIYSGPQYVVIPLERLKEVLLALHTQYEQYRESETK